MTASFKQEALKIINQSKQYISYLKEQGQDIVLFNQKKDSQPGKQSSLTSGQSAPPGSTIKSPSIASPQFDLLAFEVSQCKKCEIANSRKQTVFGQGHHAAKLVFVGEAPGADEDKQGQPFVGAAGKLLTKIIASIGLTRDEVFICNVLKCRPTGNRNPSLEEISNCRPYLERQLALIKPAIICALGTFAAQTLLGTTEPISRLRGKEHQFNGMTVIPTFHPAALLYHPQNKRLVWEDMKLIATYLKLNSQQGKS